MHGPLCPIDFEGCCDDICRGSGCLRSGGEPMVYICKDCNETSESSFCDCERDEYEEHRWRDEE